MNTLEDDKSYSLWRAGLYHLNTKGPLFLWYTFGAALALLFVQLAKISHQVYIGYVGMVVIHCLLVLVDKRTVEFWDKWESRKLNHQLFALGWVTVITTSIFNIGLTG